MAKKKIDCSELSKAIFKLAEYHAADPDVKSIDDVVVKMQSRLPDIDRKRVVDSIVEATTAQASVFSEMRQTLNDLKREARQDKEFRKKIIELEKALKGIEAPKKPKKAKKATPKEIAKLKKEASGLKKKVEARENPEALQSLAREYAKAFVASGITEREHLITLVHKEIAQFMPDVSRRSVMDAISGYGKYKELSKNPDEVVLRDLKGQMQQLAKLQDMDVMQAPKKTGQERRSPSDTEREFIAKVNERKKAGGYETTDPAKQLRSSLDAIKTRLKNQIKDLEKQIASRVLIVKDRKASPTDPEVEALRARKDELKAEFDSIFKRGMSDKQRLAAAMRSTEKSVAELERRLKEKDFAKRNTQSRPSSPELEALREYGRGLREQMNRENPNRPNLERMRERLAMLQHHIEEGTLPRPYQRKLDESPEAVQLREALGNVQDALKRQPQSIKKKYLDQIAEYEKRWAERDFAPPVKRYDPLLSPEIEHVRYEADMLRRRQRNAIRDLKPRTWTERIADPLNYARAWLTSMDLSGVLRQGGFIAFSNPRLAFKSIRPMLQAAWSKQKAHAIEQEILSRPNAKYYARAGLYLATEDSSLSHMEEAYMSSLIDRIGEKVPYDPISGSGRAYTTFLNKLRADTFDMLTETLAKNGEPTLEEMQAIANYVNVATGRGSLGRFESAGILLNTVFFAPRYVASRFQVLAGQPLYGGTANTRKLIAKEYAKYMLGIGTLYALAWGAWGMADDDDEGLNFDPRSSDFGKIRLGNAHIDPLSGMAQVTTLLGRVGTGQYTQLDGAVVDLRGEDRPYRGHTVSSKVFDFARSKFSPPVGFAFNVASGQNVVGEETGVVQESANLVIPLAWKDVVKAIQDQGVARGTALSLAAVLGIGVQIYGDD